MNQICLGLKSKAEMMEETLNEYREMYIKIKSEFGTLITVSCYSAADRARTAADKNRFLDC